MQDLSEFQQYLSRVAWGLPVVYAPSALLLEKTTEQPHQVPQSC